MKLTQAGIDFIKRYEGFSEKPYKVGDFERFFTWGYGHYGADVPSPESGKKISRVEAENLLKKDLQRFIDGVNGLIKVPITDTMFSSLVSFTYNLGVSTLQRSDLLTYLNQKNYQKAADEFPKYCHAGGKVLKGLLRRRNDEREMFLKDVDKLKPPVKKIVSLPKPILKKGDKGEGVKLLQTALTNLHFVCEVDGSFGPKTEEKLKNFQKVYCPDCVDGIYGNQTKSAMEKLLK